MKGSKASCMLCAERCIASSTLSVPGRPHLPIQHLLIAPITACKHREGGLGARPRSLPRGRPRALPVPRTGCQVSLSRATSIGRYHPPLLPCTAARCRRPRRPRQPWWAARLPHALPRAGRTHCPSPKCPLAHTLQACIPPQRHDHRAYRVRWRRGGGGGLRQLCRNRHHRLLASRLATARWGLARQPVQPLWPAVVQGGAARLPGRAAGGRRAQGTQRRRRRWCLDRCGRRRPPRRCQADSGPAFPSAAPGRCSWRWCTGCCQAGTPAAGIPGGADAAPPPPPGTH